MPYLGKTPASPATKIEDADQDTKIQVEESSDEDIIRFDIAGAEDFTMTANALNVPNSSTRHMKRHKMLLYHDLRFWILFL